VHQRANLNVLGVQGESQGAQTMIVTFQQQMDLQVQLLVVQVIIECQSGACVSRGGSSSG
jgi:hypothetical protein